MILIIDPRFHWKKGEISEEEKNSQEGKMNVFNMFVPFPFILNS